MASGGDPTASEPAVHVLADPAAVSRAAAERIAVVVEAAVARRGRADVATTGGSTPVGIYDVLSRPPLRDRVPWDRLDVWFGDDRFVPRDDDLSNVLPVDRILLGSGGPLSPERIHPFPCSIALASGRGAVWCAAAYAAEVAANVPLDDAGWPVFDLVIVGIGPDGHLLSVFPGSRAFGSTELALAIPAPTHVEPHVERVTLNPAILTAASDVLVVCHGGSKAAVIGAIFGTVRDPDRWPAQLTRRGGATWLLDTAAAALVSRPPD